MKKIFVIILAFGLAISMANFKSSASAAEWSVPGNFATIQDAIDDTSVNDGDKIMVGPGQHAGAIVKKAVEIKGEEGAVVNSGPLLTTYQPCGTIVLDIGFQFGFVGYPPGSGATISHIKFEGVAFPIFSRGADNVTVTQCTMVNPIQGVTNWAGNGWEISHNVITDLRSANGGGIAIIVADHLGGTVTDNIVSHNKISGTLMLRHVMVVVMMAPASPCMQTFAGAKQVQPSFQITA
jgi:hypothetical protein